MWRLRRGDVAVGRLDVLATLDGVEPGLSSLNVLARRGVRVLNGAAALLATHDKLETARRLRAWGVSHPATVHVSSPRDRPPFATPVVVKPRFGSWGRDVFLCSSETELVACLETVRGRSWFARHGALVQELVPPCGHDLRLVVAGGRVVGAALRRAAAGDWRANVSLGGSLHRAEITDDAAALAIASAAAVGMELVGVDLLPLPDGGYVTVELNGAVDFDRRYSVSGGDVFADAADALAFSRASVRGDVRDFGA